MRWVSHRVTALMRFLFMALIVFKVMLLGFFGWLLYSFYYFCVLPLSDVRARAAQQSNQSPMSLTSDASSPRSYVSPRISTPQTNAGPLKPLLSTQSAISQAKVRCHTHFVFPLELVGSVIKSCDCVQSLNLCASPLSA